MFDDLRYYLLKMRITLERKNLPVQPLMDEISQVAVKNWVDREDGTPDLTANQLLSVSRRVIARKYYIN